jgi:hypothetical protein
MSEPASPPISLNDIGSRYLGALQHLSDFMVLTWAGARGVNEQHYEEIFRTVSGLPSTQARLPFAAAKAEGERWWLKNSVADVMSLLLVFLEDIRKVCGMITFNVAKINASGDLVALAALINADLGPLDIPTRFKNLKERYQLGIPLEAELMSLAAFHRCFTHAGGVVPKGASLTLHLKAIQPPPEGETQARIGDYRRTWSAGERISLSREEHAAVFTTASVFLDSMLHAVQQFAKSSGLPENPTHS